MAEATLIDVNISLGQWPFRRLHGDTIDDMVTLLRANHVTQAWAGHFDGLLHKDITGVNARLAETCADHVDLLIPFGSANPTLPDWEEDLRRCAEDWRMSGIRLHPNYHGYTLTDAVFVPLLQQAAAHNLIIQIALLMEDTRMMHPLMQVPNVDVAPLASALEAAPEAKVILLNALQLVNGAHATTLAQAGNVYFDIATLEGVNGIGNILDHIPFERLLFGSHAPLFYYESALLKLHEAQLTVEQMDAIRQGNATKLMA